MTAGGDPNDRQGEVDRLKRRLLDHDETVKQLGDSLARLRVAVRVRSETADALVAAADARVAAANERVAEAESRVADIESSWSWRVGRIAVFLPGRVKRLIKRK